MNLLQDFLTLWRRKEKMVSSEVKGTDYIAVFRSRKSPHKSSVTVADPGSVLKIIPAAQLLSGIDDLCDVPLTGYPIDCTGPESDGDVMLWNESDQEWQFGPAGQIAPKEVIVVEAVKTCFPGEGSKPKSTEEEGKPTEEEGKPTEGEGEGEGDGKPPIDEGDGDNGDGDNGGKPDEGDGDGDFTKPPTSEPCPLPLKEDTSCLNKCFYEGISTIGNVSAYSAEVIYKVRFNVTNDWGPDPIDPNWITGLRIDKNTCTTAADCGIQAMQTGTMSGFENLAPNSIIPGVYYYLAWDGQRFQFYTENPDNTQPTTFRNENATSASNLEGIPAGTTFPTSQTMQQMWDMLLYPYQKPSFTDFEATCTIDGEETKLFEQPFECGFVITSRGGTNFNWVPLLQGNMDTGSLIDRTAGNQPLSSNIDLSTITTISGISIDDFTRLNPLDTYQFSLEGTNTDSPAGAIVPAIGEVEFLLNIMWGKISNSCVPQVRDGDPASEKAFQEFLINISQNKKLSKIADGEYIFEESSSPRYLYIAIPTYIDPPSLITSMDIEMVMASNVLCGEGEEQTTQFRFGLPESPYKFEFRNITNQFNVDYPYFIYRSHNKFAGEVNIKINLH